MPLPYLEGEKEVVKATPMPTPDEIKKDDKDKEDVDGYVESGEETETIE